MMHNILANRKLSSKNVVFILQIVAGIAQLVITFIMSCLTSVLHVTVFCLNLVLLARRLMSIWPVLSLAWLPAAH